VYQTDYEHHGRNYVPTDLAGRYDAFLFVDKTSALRAISARRERKELLPETWPMGQ
jgi:erythromycin esterase